MKTQNLAVMFTDIKGFTAKTSRQTREENALMLRRHEALLLPLVKAFGGRRVKTIGDAFLCVFPSPTNSVLCGMAMQDRLWDYNRRVTLDDDRIEVRVAVNLGEVRLSGGDVFGEPVNIAARVEAEAEAGEVWFTESVYLAMNKAEAPASEVGYRELKGIPEKVRLYKVPRGQYQLAATPAAAPADAASEPLPQPPYGNVGLGRVKGLPPPVPEDLARATTGELGRAGLGGLVRHARRVGSDRRAVGVATAVAALLLVFALFVLARSGPEGLIDAGKLGEAQAAIEKLAARHGANDPDVLYLRGRLAQEQAKLGQAGEGEAFDWWSRAAAAGSRRALKQLTRAAESSECRQKRQAARALANSRNEDALPVLRRLAEDEPAPPPQNALEKLVRRVVPAGKCGYGDIARQGIEDMEGEKQP